MKTEEFKFFCNGYEWSFWERILPCVAYAKTGMSVNELIDDALSFYVYSYSSIDHWDADWKPWDFAEVSWNVITGFYDLSEMLTEIGESVDESIQKQRIFQLYLEQALGCILENRPNEFGVNKHLRLDPALDNIRSVSSPQELKTIFYSHYSIESIAKVIKATSPAMLSCKRVDARVILSENTLKGFRKITQHFGMTNIEAILIVLRQMAQFIPLSQNYSASFREDLFLRKQICKSLTNRLLEELEITISYCTAADISGEVLSERLACLHNKIPRGQSMVDFLANEETIRERDDTDFSKYTELTEDERLMGNHLLF